MFTENVTIKTHRCDESLKQKTSVRLEWVWWCEKVKWLIGELDYTDEWNSPYLHQLSVGIKYCPFCGKELGVEE